MPADAVKARCPDGTVFAVRPGASSAKDLDRCRGHVEYLDADGAVTRTAMWLE